MRQNPNSLYPPNITPLGNRDEVGIVTKIDHWAANPQQAAEWLKLTGCKRIFFTSAYTGEGIEEIFEFLREEHDICPVEKVMDALDKASFGKAGRTSSLSPSVNIFKYTPK